MDELAHKIAQMGDELAETRVKMEAEWADLKHAGDECTALDDTIRKALANTEEIPGNEVLIDWKSRMDAWAMLVKNSADRHMERFQANREKYADALAMCEGFSPEDPSWEDTVAKIRGMMEDNDKIMNMFGGIKTLSLDKHARVESLIGSVIRNRQQ
jgi:hypothetical protein